MWYIIALGNLILRKQAVLNGTCSIPLFWDKELFLSHYLKDVYNYNLGLSQRMLAQLVSHSGGTPQVLSSTPCGSEFQPEGKKIPSLAPVSGRGQGSGIFSVGEADASSRKSIPVGRSFPTRPSFFYNLGLKKSK